LRLAGKQNKKKFKINPTGNFEDIEAYFNADRGDIMVNLTKVKEFKAAPRVFEEEGSGENNTRKVLIRSSLFGSTKPYGAIMRKANYSGKNFSHKSQFGHKFVLNKPAIKSDNTA